ncbi:MAG: pyridoxamine 5'-phosphate oxidase family protein [Myxococcota bacterium]
MTEVSPFHAGEQQIQTQLGVSDIDHWARKVVRPYLPEEHRAFHAAQPFLVAAARDRRGRPWATLLAGEPGFVASPDDRSLAIDARPPRGDALEDALVPGADLGLLGIEFATRRRNRLNGRIAEAAQALVFRVDQSFGNCPQYIHERNWQRVCEAPGDPRRTDRLSPSQQRWIREADTFFIASGYRGEGESPSFGMDASHRGGEPGFVVVEDPTCLVFPDYAGNNHFNTLGNLLLDPRAGFLFVDFTSGSLLQITGHTRIDWDSDDLARFPGARRLVALDVEEVVELPRAIPLRFEASAEAVRSVRVVEKRRESEDVTSLVLAARDGGPLPRFDAGQHLPVELEVPDTTESVRRTYSLSGDPADPHYRITVKREPQGLASRFLHDRVEEGDILSVRKPAGDFRVGCTECPVVLVSAGVGVTPMVSMLQALASEASERPVWFVHGARDGDHHPLADEVRDVAARAIGIRVHTAYSRPRPEDTAHDSVGRVDAALLARLVDRPDAHYFLCGPVGFLAGLQSELEARGVPREHIHAETFGPVG